MDKKNLKLTNIMNRKDNVNPDEILLFNAYNVQDASSKALYVCQSGVKKWKSPGWNSGPAIYDHYIIHYLYSGEGIYCCKNRKYTIKAGNMFLIEPYTEVTYQADTENPYQYYWVGFNGVESHELLERSGFTDIDLVINCDGEKQKTIMSIMDHIANIRTTSISTQYSLIGLLYQLFGEMIRNNEQTSRRSSRYYYDAITFIRQNATRLEITAKEVAAHIGVERSHLYRIFKENGQFTVKEIITATKMEKAKLFLCNTDQSIEDIATYSGFKNSSHFSQFFRKIEGITPLQFRNRERQASQKKNNV